MRENTNILLSIIVPVYNVEPYIQACIESIYQQGLDEKDFEVIIVNDGTQDNSMKVIEGCISQHNNIIVINQENQGLSMARNNGIVVAKGKYILMPDSDDLLIENSLRPLLEKAIETQADLVVADFLRMTNDEIKNLHIIQQKEFFTKEKSGEQLFLEDLIPHECYVWRTLYKREFLIEANLRFIPGITYEDVPFTHKCYLKAQKCIKVSWFLYIYRKQSESITETFNLKKAKDFCIAIEKTWELTKLKGFSSSTYFKLHEDIWTSFTVLICYSCHHLRNKDERFKMIDFLKEQVPNFYFRNGIKQKLYSFLYKNVPHIFIQLRYIYGVIFENNAKPLYHQFRRLVLTR